MTILYSARWVLPVATAPIAKGAIAIEGAEIVGVGSESSAIAALSRL